MSCSYSVCPNEGTLICSQCKNTKYCSRKCQRADWKRHKCECQQKAPKESKEFLNFEQHLEMAILLGSFSNLKDTPKLEALRAQLGSHLNYFPEKPPTCQVTGKLLTETKSLSLVSSAIASLQGCLPAPPNFALAMYIYSGLYFTPSGELNYVGHCGEPKSRSDPGVQGNLQNYIMMFRMLGPQGFVNEFFKGISWEVYLKAVETSPLGTMDLDNKNFHQTGEIYGFPKDINSILNIIRQLKKRGIKGIIDPFCGRGFFVALLVICGWSPDAIFASDIEVKHSVDYLSMAGIPRHRADATKGETYAKAIEALKGNPSQIAVLLNWTDLPPTKPSIGAMKKINQFGFNCLIEGSELPGCAICEETTDELKKWHKTTISSIWVGNFLIGGPNNIFICDRDPAYQSLTPKYPSTVGLFAYP